MIEFAPGHVQALVDPKHFAWVTGVKLRGYTVKEIPTGWQVIVKGNLGDGTPVYSLYAAGELGKALTGVLRILGSKGGSRYWHKDKYG